MKFRVAAMVAGVAWMSMFGNADASYLFNIAEVGNSVVFTGSGSFDLGILTYFQPNSEGDFVFPSGAALIIGDTTTDGSQYRVGFISNGDGFGLPTITDLPNGTGPEVGFFSDAGYVYLPQNYTGGELGISTVTVDNASFASLGIIPGVYTYTLYPIDNSFATFSVAASTFSVAAASDLITVNVVGTSPVPLPASAPLFGAALLGVAGFGYAMKRTKDALA